MNAHDRYWLHISIKIHLADAYLAFIPESMVRCKSHQSQRDTSVILSSHPLGSPCADLPHLTAAMEKHPRWEKEGIFEKQHWMCFVWQNSRDIVFPLAIQKGGVGVDKEHIHAMFRNGCQPLNVCTVYFWCHITFLPILLQLTPEILTQSMCLLSCGGICNTMGLMQAGKW